MNKQTIINIVCIFMTINTHTAFTQNPDKLDKMFTDQTPTGRESAEIVAAIFASIEKEPSLTATSAQAEDEKTNPTTTHTNVPIRPIPRAAQSKSISKAKAASPSKEETKSNLTIRQQNDTSVQPYACILPNCRCKQQYSSKKSSVITHIFSKRNKAILLAALQTIYPKANEAALQLIQTNRKQIATLFIKKN